MVLYINGSKVKEYGSYGLRFNGSNIAKAYFNGSLVYQYQPYAPSTLITTITNGGTYNVTLPIGVYQLHIAGGGGNSANGMIHYGGSTWVPWAVGGGSGAAWEGQFYNPIKQSFKLYAGKVVESSYMELGGTRMITAGNGTSGAQAGQWMTTGSGGSISVSSDFNNNIITTTLSKNGNGGGNGNTNGGATVSTSNWGEGDKITTSGAIQAGGAKLWYIRYSK